MIDDHKKRRDYHQEYRARNKEKARLYGLRYRIENAEKLKQKRLEWYASNRALVLERRRKDYAAKAMSSIAKEFGVTPERYDKMFAEQRGVCKICQQPSRGIRLYIDHDHSKKRVRGLLCRECNLGLGFFNDDEKRLFWAIKYLAEGWELDV